MSSSSIKDLKNASRWLSQYYTKLGPVEHLYELEVPVVSSSIFGFKTVAGKFCLKIPRFRKNESAIGSTAELDQWRLIAETRVRLFESGVSVEECIPTDNGQFILRENGEYGWVSRYYHSVEFSGNSMQLRMAGRLLGSFHLAAENLLACDSDLIRRLEKLPRRDMPLAESLEKISLIENWLTVAPDLLRREGQAEMAETIVSISNLLAKYVLPRIDGFFDGLGGNEEMTLVHNDFHPANILYLPQDDDAVMLDFEQMAIGPILRCLAFSLARFSFESYRINGQASVGDAARIFLAGYEELVPLTIEERKSIPRWIAAYELEKILRILWRYMNNRSFPQYVSRILTHHIPVFSEADTYAVA